MPILQIKKSIRSGAQTDKFIGNEPLLPNTPEK